MGNEESTRGTLQAFAEAWKAGDIARVIDTYSNDFVLHYFGETDLAGTYEGKAASVGAMMAVSGRAKRTLIDIVDVLAGAEMGAVVVRERLSKGTDESDVQRVILYRVADNKIIESWLHDQDQRLVDRFWRRDDSPEA